MFLENKIDPTLKDSDGKSAPDYANEFSADPEVIRMVKDVVNRTRRSK